MEASDVASLLGHLSARGVRACVAGGWAVDALLGRQTRHHRDLDLAIDADQLEELLDLLGALGFEPREDWLPVRIELEDSFGRRVDLHPLRFAEDGSAVQASLGSTDFYYPSDAFTTGCIAGRAVDCLTAEQQLVFREGYNWRAQDYHDVPLLRRWIDSQPLRSGYGSSCESPPLSVS
jgi:lincosamide nucleotidyltransferase A/C/D/E